MFSASKEETGTTYNFYGSIDTVGNVGGNGNSSRIGNEKILSKNERSSLRNEFSLDSKRSTDQSRQATKRIKKDIPKTHDGYETGLINLWGEDTLWQLRQFVRIGEIEDHHIQNMATTMGVKRTYNENCKKIDLVETFERMLRDWFNQNLFELEPTEAKDKLVNVLIDGRCTKRIVKTIQSLCYYK